MRIAVGQTLGRIRLVSRGLGMGGPPSPFLWNVGYDPIVVGLAEALDIDDRTCVDDLAGLGFDPGDSCAAELFLLVASQAA